MGLSRLRSLGLSLSFPVFSVILSLSVVVTVGSRLQVWREVGGHIRGHKNREWIVICIG